MMEMRNREMIMGRGDYTDEASAGTSEDSQLHMIRSSKAPCEDDNSTKDMEILPGAKFSQIFYICVLSLLAKQFPYLGKGRDYDMLTWKFSQTPFV